MNDTKKKRNVMIFFSSFMHPRNNLGGLKLGVPRYEVLLIQKENDKSLFGRRKKVICESIFDAVKKRTQLLPDPTKNTRPYRLKFYVILSTYHRNTYNFKEK